MDILCCGKKFNEMHNERGLQYIYTENCETDFVNNRKMNEGILTKFSLKNSPRKILTDKSLSMIPMH